MSEDLKRGETAFASAARADIEQLERQRAAFMADPTAAAVLDAMPGPAMILNRNRQILIANHLLRETLSPDDADRIIGMRPGEALHCIRSSERPGGCGTAPACSQCGAVGAIIESLATHKRITRECRIRTYGVVDGGACDFRVHSTWLQVAGVEFVVFALEDISSEKRRALLERTFFHDLLNTCGGLQNLATILATDKLEPAVEVEWKHEISLLSGIAVDQIQSQRQLLAAERGELGPSIEAVDIAGLLEAQVTLYRHSPVCEGRHILLENVRHGSIHTDPTLLGRVVGNLVKNALEATPPGGTVTVSAELDGNELTASVHNDGVIPEAIQLQIFQRSFSTKGGAGRGIGTYSVKLLTERYLKGQAQFVSNDRIGTLFVIVVPDLAAEARRAA
ncbi:MAG: sensor histidine kinase [Candidatus Eisenbacteria bacterium]|nr:sensor histidine kinase [Candidatus Eisenbacteria bacterium]